AGKAMLPSLVATMTVPLVADDELLGVMFVHWTRAHQLSEGDLELAEALGSHAATALRTAHLLEEARRAREIAAERARLEGALTTARTAAHRLNNALALVTGYGDLLRPLVD